MLVAYTQIGPYKYISKKVVRVTTMWLCDEEHNSTDIRDKRKPISDEQQTVYNKRQRKAEYDRQYRARKKALLATSISDEQQQTIKDKLRRKAEYNRQYRARKKALLATSSANYDKQALLGTSSANNDNIACDFAQPSTSTGIEHPVAAVSAVNSITDVTPQKNITSSVYDCTVEDVEYIYNKFSHRLSLL